MIIIIIIIVVVIIITTTIIIIIIQYSIDKTSETPLCRLCGDATETVQHIVSGCKKLAQRDCRKCHDKVALQIHWEMCRKYGIECTDKWYDHQPLPIAKWKSEDYL